MKKYTFLFTIAALMGSLLCLSCGEEFLTSSSAEKRAAGEAVTETAILSFLGSAYQPLLFDSYAANNYNAILFMSDLRSDDIYKGGGSADDQLYLYHLSLFTTSPTTSLIGLWTLYYSGLARCNNVLMNCDNAANIAPDKLEQYKAEAHFLRAYYTHLLWKFFGNIPYFTEHLQSPFLAPQYTANDIYGFIMDDLDYACVQGRMEMKTDGSNLGRASRAAALMLKARVVLYQKDQSRYAEITNDMATIISSGAYRLFDDFAAMWDDENEFCSESIFESNQLPEGKVWASGWQGYGTNFPAFISPDG
ncbi:MAG: RagB/SusD family nutrient uptake outer membrane protein, partial [Prevotellaceae bacterium]|nr:RagB/SusD family nutrient uptake outer membrane protein [Prevotellaceae bacterium]